MPAFGRLLSRLGIRTDDPFVAAIIATVLATAVVQLVKPIWQRMRQQWNSLCRWLFRSLLPVNNDMSTSKLEMFEAYYDTVGKRIRRLLPEEITEVWESENLQVPSTMIQLRAERIPTAESELVESRAIRNVLEFIDHELIYNVTDPLRPITVQGEPGSGKSCFVFELFRQLGTQLRRYRQGWIPVLLFAHELS